MEATGTSHNTQLQMFSTFKLENWYLFHNIRTEITSQQRTQQCLHENYSSPHCELNFGSRDQFTCRAREQRPKLKQISTIPAPQKMAKYMDVLAARMYAYVPAIRALPWNSGCRLDFISGTCACSTEASFHTCRGHSRSGRAHHRNPSHPRSRRRSPHSCYNRNQNSTRILMVLEEHMS